MVRPTRCCANSFHTALETPTVTATFGLFQSLSLETYRGRLLLVHLWALPSQAHSSVCLAWEDQLARMLALHLGITDT